ncbi:MAG: DUF1269 domain-containing protein [Coriobacteriia bacterium]|nr:DUF1269 domain-containing protein [Coriobacteriia bacterium]
MATLVAMSYPGDPNRATQAALHLEDLPIADSSDLEDVVVVTTNDRGRAHLTQTTRLISEGAIYGALFGMVAGVLGTWISGIDAALSILAMTLGLAVAGALIGAGIGRNRDFGIADDFVRAASAKLPANSSALFVLLDGGHDEHVLAALATCGGELLTSDLPSADAARLRQAAKTAQRRKAVRAL